MLTDEVRIRFWAMVNVIDVQFDYIIDGNLAECFDWAVVEIMPIWVSYFGMPMFDAKWVIIIVHYQVFFIFFFRLTHDWSHENAAKSSFNCFFVKGKNLMRMVLNFAISVENLNLLVNVKFQEFFLKLF